MKVSIDEYNKLPAKQRETIEALCSRSFISLERARANMVIESTFPRGDVTILGINNKNAKITHDGGIYY
jgi:hypothetical protein